MARVPLQSLVSARQSGVELQPGVFQQAARANAELFGSIAGGVEMVKQQFDKAQDLKNRSDISDKKLLIRNSQAEFQNRLIQDNVEPALWPVLWKKQLSVVEKQLGLNSSEVPPVVRDAVGEAFKSFSGTSLIQISGTALKENQRRAKQNFDRDLQYSYQTNDFAGANALVEQNRDLLGDDFADDTLRTNGLIQRNKEMEYSLQNDPIGHKEKIQRGDFGDLPKWDVQKQEQAADDRVKRLESEGLATIRELDEAGLIDGEEDLIAQLDSDPTISEVSKKRFLKNYRSNQPLPAKEQSAIKDRIYGNLTKLQNGEIDAEEYEREWVDIQSEVHTYGNRKGVGRFNSDLHNMRPSLFTQEKLDAEALRKRAKEVAPIQSLAHDLIKARASGLASIAYDSVKTSGDYLTEEQKLGNKSLKLKMDEHSLLLEFELEKAVDGFVLSSDGKPTSQDIKKFLDDNADKINLTVLKNITSPEGKTPEEKSEIESPASRAQNFLLPPKGAIQVR